MRSTRAIIHLKNLRHNLSVIQSLCPQSRICLAVKANAYGHGAAEVAKTALDWGVFALGVATADEAIELRASGIMAPIVLYGIASPQEIPALIQAGTEIFCTDGDLLRLIATEARIQAKTARVHLKVDTGMGRIGCTPEESIFLAESAQVFAQKGLVQMAGISTHLPVSEDNDTRYTDAQIEGFLAIVEGIRAKGIDPGLVHLANSGGIVLHKKAGLDMVRPGIMAYGYAPGTLGFDHLDLRPVMELRTSLCFVKQVPSETPISYGHTWKTPSRRWIGTVPVGYADGLHRAASGKFGLLEADPGTKEAQLFPQIGTICMDQCMVDLGEYVPDEFGQVVRPPIDRWQDLVIFGPQEGAASAADIAKAANTIPYEITCGISPRVPRIYVED